MLYEIREEEGKRPFKLFFKKKKGLKFKKAFVSQQVAEWFIDNYLRHACLCCKQRGWVYKVQLPETFRGRLNSGRRRYPPTGIIAICPECKSPHQVQHESVRCDVNGHVFMATKIVLVPIAD